MSRYTGKSLDVKVNGISVSYSLGWTMDTDMQTAERFGVGATVPDVGVVYDRKRGSFECESDPADSVQTAILLNPTEGSLTLYEHSGVSFAIENALISAAVSSNRGGSPTKRFQWVEIPA